MKKIKYIYIENKKALKDFVVSIKKAKKIAVDMEADSLFNFESRVCLLQIRAMRKNAIIDTVKLCDLSLLKTIFADKKIEKIFHGADYDVRSLARDFDFEINNIFDTELASRFLGIKKTNLQDMILGNFGVKIDKKYQKKNWSLRPLSKEMLDYAIGDVAFLLPLSNILKKQLREKKNDFFG